MELLGFLVGFVGLVLAFLEWRKAGRAEKKAQAAEATTKAAEEKLAQAKRIADAPYLRVCKDRFDSITADGYSFPSFTTNLLCFLSPVVKKLDPGAKVYFLLSNIGEQAFDIRFHMPQRGISIVGNIEIAGRQTKNCILVYEFDPGAFGSWEILKLDFTTAQGFQDSHTYEVQHGHRAIRRIDPLPVTIHAL